MIRPASSLNVPLTFRVNKFGNGAVAVVAAAVVVEDDEEEDDGSSPSTFFFFFRSLCFCGSAPLPALRPPNKTFITLRIVSFGTSIDGTNLNPHNCQH